MPLLGCIAKKAGDIDTVLTTAEAEGARLPLAEVDKVLPGGVLLECKILRQVLHAQNKATFRSALKKLWLQRNTCLAFQLPAFGTSSA
jgi:hypothetical protein